MSHYLNWREIDGYNARINEILTTRGYGKTYGMDKKIFTYIDRNPGRKFMYIVRRPTDIDDILNSGTTPFANYLTDEPRDVIMNRKGFWYADEEGKPGRHIGYFFPLSKAKRLKKLSYNDVDIILFDEFLIEENDPENYLENEPEYFMSLMDTAFRNRNNVRAYLLGNATVFYNPYNLYWGIEKPWGKTQKLYLDGQILLYMKAPEDFIEFRKETAMGKLISSVGGKYAEMALYNRFQGEQQGFIEKHPKEAAYFYTIYTPQAIFGIWGEGRKIYVSFSVDEGNPNKYAINMFQPPAGAYLIGKRITRTPIETILTLYRHGMVWFESMKVKELFRYVLLEYL